MSTSVVLMPKAAMNEYRNFAATKCDVGTGRSDALVNSKTIPQSKEALANKHLWFRVLALDLCHHRGARLLRHYVYHYMFLLLAWTECCV